MKIINQLYKLCIGLIFGIASVAAELTAAMPTNEVLNQKINLFLKEANFQGAVLIAKNGEILFKSGFGLANYEHLIPNTTETVFRIGSITKLFTAIAILQLQEKGLLNVHDPLTKYFPNYPKGESITIHHLLSHTSGIPSITEFPNILEIQRLPSSPQQVMEYFKDLPLNFAPGTDCEYSNSGPIVLGAIIEIVTKKSYAEYIQESILHPLKMNSTFYDYNRMIIPHRATGYVKNDHDILEHPPYVDMSFPHASGALASTVEDLYRLDRALKNHTILKEESRRALFTVHGASKKNRISYGYGLEIGPQNSGMEGTKSTIVGHSGTIEGFEAVLIRYLDDDLTIIVLSNLEKTDIPSIHKKIASIVSSGWRLHQ